MSLEASKAQSLANFQPPPAPIPPSYLTSLALTPEEVLAFALEDVAQRGAPSESPFYVPADQRRNLGAEALHQRLVDTWENLPLYVPFSANSQDTSFAGGIIEAFFQVIAQGNILLAQRILQSNLLDANTPKLDPEHGLTPLLCAIQHKQHDIVILLLSHGARVNDFGVCRPLSIENSQMREPEENKHWTSEAAVRTPIQLAAQLGDLGLVKLLFEDYHADDSITAPDGQLALRLAKGNGHRAIVAYLPARRGGGYRRWKTKHYKFMKKMEKSVTFFQKTGKLVFWRIPRWFCLCITESVKATSTFIWKNKHKIPGFCWQLLKDLGRFLLKLPKYLCKFVVECWKSCVVLVTQKIPRAIVLLWKLLKNLTEEIARALLWILNRAASFLHTLFHAIVSAFKALTWTNVRAGFLDFIRAVFVSIPCAVYQGIKKTIPATWKGLVGLVKGLSWCAFMIVILTLKAMEIVFTHLWKIITAMAGTTAGAGKEVYVWFNPKG